ncbi:MAG TPA: ATP-binding protein [Nevskia sp.]|nr:ATP-binding protein [Nevskia sp.]
MDEVEKIWHYNRPRAAEQLLATFQSAGNNKVVMFERRRRGKTDLLLYDVTPAAESLGYQVIYVNMWDNSADPAGHLLSEYVAALKPRTLAERAANWGRSPVEKIKLSGELYGAKGEMEVGLSKKDDKAVAGILEALKDTAARLAARRKKILLLIDEVQTLGEDQGNLPLVRALRTQLDTHKNRIDAIFTGSSREGLLRMFAAEKAPFFRSSESFTLPEMDRGFVQHLLGVFSNITSLPMDEAAAVKVFEAVRKSPYHFRKIIGLAVQLKEADVGRALEIYRRRLAEQEGYVVTWQGLTPYERAVVYALAIGHTSIYARDTLADMRRLLGSTPSTSNVQKAATGLIAKRLVTKSNPQPLTSDRTNYILDDEEFGEWLRAEGLSAGGRGAVGD